MLNALRRRIPIVAGLAALAALLLLPRPLASAPDAIPHYDFAITLDYPGHRLEAVQRLSVPNTFGVSVSDIVFNVPARHQPGVLTLHSVNIDGVPVQHQLNGTILRVRLPRPLPPHESVTLTLDFSVRVPELIDPQ